MKCPMHTMQWRSHAPADAQDPRALPHSCADIAPWLRVMSMVGAGSQKASSRCRERPMATSPVNGRCSLTAGFIHVQRATHGNVSCQWQAQASPKARPLTVRDAGRMRSSFISMPNTTGNLSCTNEGAVFIGLGSSKGMCSSFMGMPDTFEDLGKARCNPHVWCSNMRQKADRSLHAPQGSSPKQHPVAWLAVVLSSCACTSTQPTLAGIAYALQKQSCQE